MRFRDGLVHQASELQRPRTAERLMASLSPIERYCSLAKISSQHTKPDFLLNDHANARMGALHAKREAAPFSCMRSGTPGGAEVRAAMLSISLFDLAQLLAAAAPKAADTARRSVAVSR